MPRNGHGEFRRIATHLRLHSTMVSQIFRGDRELTAEQAWSLCEYLGLNDLESDYFLALVDLSRAGTESLKQRIRRKLQEIRERALQVGNRLPQAATLTDAEKAIFYSVWYYSAIRLLTSIPEFQSVDALSNRLDLPKSLVSQVVEFLLSVGLCVEEDGKLKMGPSRTHIGADSPLIGRHHANWRFKAIERVGRVSKSSESELIFTSPLTIATRDAAEAREILLQAIEKISARVEGGDPEKLFCLNVDWFEVKA